MDSSILRQSLQQRSFFSVSKDIDGVKVSHRSQPMSAMPHCKASSRTSSSSPNKKWPRELPNALLGSSINSGVNQRHAHDWALAMFKILAEIPDFSIFFCIVFILFSSKMDKRMRSGVQQTYRSKSYVYHRLILSCRVR